MRTSGDPASVARPVEAAVQTLIPTLPITGIVPMTQLMSDAVARQRVSTVVLAMFSVIAMLLAAVGLYGVVSHSVTERTREIGVRMALGADGRKVVRMFVSQGLLTAGAGVAIGLPAAVVLARSLESLLFGVPPSGSGYARGGRRRPARHGVDRVLPAGAPRIAHRSPGCPSR